MDPWHLRTSQSVAMVKNQVNMNELTWKTQVLRDVHSLESCRVVEEQTCQMARMMLPVLSVFNKT